MSLQQIQITSAASSSTAGTESATTAVAGIGVVARGVVFVMRAGGEVRRGHVRAGVTDVNDLCRDGRRYLTSAGRYWFVMNRDNDLPRDLVRSRQPINLAFRRWFPASQYVGDILVVRTRSARSDTIDTRPWSLRRLARFLAAPSTDPNDHHLNIGLKVTT